MKETKNILIIAICFFIAVFGLYMQFFANDKETVEEPEKTVEIVENEISGEIPELQKEVNEMLQEQENLGEQEPLPEEELEAQTYGFGALNVYFTNMEEIQNDDEFLPYMGYADLVSATVDFLEQQTEVVLPESGNIELSLSPGMTYKRHNLISFHCYFTDIDTDLEIEYVYDDTRYEYTDIHFVEKGEWDILWKK